jgi:hypothetical protein
MDAKKDIIQRLVNIMSLVYPVYPHNKRPNTFAIIDSSAFSTKKSAESGAKYGYNLE